MEIGVGHRLHGTENNTIKESKPRTHANGTSLGTVEAVRAGFDSKAFVTHDCGITPLSPDDGAIRPRYNKKWILIELNVCKDLKVYS